MKLSPEWLDNTSLTNAMSALTEAGFEAYLVGGCVRDAVLDVPCNDIDIATSAEPDEVRSVLKAAGYKMIPTGVEHGTWTIRRGKDTYEVTTFRQDVSTDGRRSTVEFATSMEVDAMRRDFTMNALYMDVDGNVYDPTGSGIDDARSGSVRFVGDASQRCEEDLLRIMRLFRFHAKYGKGDIDNEAYAAANKYVTEIHEKVSGERIWEETKKILAVDDPTEVMLAMERCGVFEHVFGISAHMWRLPELILAETHANAKPMWHRRYLKVLGRNIPFPASKAEHRQLQLLATACERDATVAALAQEFGKHIPFDRHLVNGSTDKFDAQECRRGVDSKFPLTADDLINSEGYDEGKRLGDALRAAKKAWVDSDLMATKEELIPIALGS